MHAFLAEPPPERPQGSQNDPPGIISEPLLAPFGLPLASLWPSFFTPCFSMRFGVRFGLARAAPGGTRRQQDMTSGAVVKPPFGSNNGGFTVCLCIFSPYAFSWGGRRGIKGVTIQVWQPRRCQNVWPLWSGVNNSGKTEVAPAVCGETRIRPVGRTVWQSMASQV